MDRLYNYLDQKVLTEITTTMFLTFTKISTIADFSVKMSSDRYAVHHCLPLVLLSTFRLITNFR